LNMDSTFGFVLRICGRDIPRGPLAWGLVKDAPDDLSGIGSAGAMSLTRRVRDSGDREYMVGVSQGRCVPSKRRLAEPADLDCRVNFAKINSIQF
jgi:hypothetical protein